MKEIQEWNPYYIGASCSLYRPEQFYPWLYPYGSSRRYISLWNDPEQMEDVEDKKRIMEMYPLMARRLQPYVEECCDRLEYAGEKEEKTPEIDWLRVLDPPEKDC